MPNIPSELQERIYIEPNTDCWFWLGPLTSEGYARVYIDGRQRLGHRALWKLFHGPIEQPLHHRCETKCCVNPRHQEPVNTVEHGLRHRKTICKNGHDLTLPDARRPKGCCRVCDNLANARSVEKYRERYNARRRSRRRSARSAAICLRSPSTYSA